MVGMEGSDICWSVYWLEWKVQISVGVCNGWNRRFRYLLECVMVGMDGSDKQ